MHNRTCAILVSALILSIAPATARAQGGGSRYALLIAGIGGTPEYTSQYHALVYESRAALIERFMFTPDDIIVLADSPSPDEEFIDDVSTAANIEAAFDELAERVSPGDDVYVILFGHGSFDGENSMLNLPRQDLKDSDYAELVDAIDARSIIFINTASCSAPFITHLSAPNRIVITATKSATERNETVFPEFLVEALKSETADRDKDGDLSVREVFQYATERTARWYEDSGHLATEHPQLEDTGDRRGFRFPEIAEAGEGDFAGATFLMDRSQQMAARAADSGDSDLEALYEQQLAVNQEISQLKAEKTSYEEAEYYSLLEPLLVRLARIAGEIEARQGNP